MTSFSLQAKRILTPNLALLIHALVSLLRNHSLLCRRMRFSFCSTEGPRAAGLFCDIGSYGQFVLAKRRSAVMLYLLLESQQLRLRKQR